jgi:hypothetical protein
MADLVVQGMPPQQADSEAIWLPGGGLGRLGRFRGAGSLCDQLGERSLRGTVCGWRRTSPCKQSADVELVTNKRRQSVSVRV